MNAVRLSRLAVILAVALSVTAARAVTIDWVTVGDPGNAGHTLTYSGTNMTFGAVATTFQIQKYEWTNAQYVTFLNAVDPDGTNPDAIYNALMGTDARGGISFTTGNSTGAKYASRTDMAGKPVNYVNWFDAARVANWLQAGGTSYQSSVSGSAAINAGAYTLTSGTNATAAARNVGATYWLPTEDQWYKAAYYKGSGTNAGYWTYAMQSNSTPLTVGATLVGTGTLSAVSPVTTGNSANFNFAADWNSQDGNVTTVGTNGGASAYGTFDMSGNVREWTDLTGSAGSTRALRGGAYISAAFGVSTGYRGVVSPTYTEYSDGGFRLASASVPEVDPAGMGSVIAFVTGALGLLERRRIGRRGDRRAANSPWTKSLRGLCPRENFRF
jgi:sulfatase modifying factor 1